MLDGFDLATGNAVGEDIKDSEVGSGSDWSRCPTVGAWRRRRPVPWTTLRVARESWPVVEPACFPRKPSHLSWFSSSLPLLVLRLPSPVSPSFYQAPQEG